VAGTYTSAEARVLGYYTSTTIDAPIDLTWRVLVDIEKMPEWTSSMRVVRLLGGGQLARDSRVRIEQPWLRPAIWTVDLFDPPSYFSWRSRTGLVETVGSHLLEDRGQTTLATLAIQHNGPGAGAVALLSGPLTRRYVRRELFGLKSRTELLAAEEGH
jgi:uncharacterized membrane protein